MLEVILKANDEQEMKDAFASVGGVDESGNIIANGVLASGGGYFVNVVGTVSQPTGETVKDEFGNSVPVSAPVPGYWARVRINGAPGTIDTDLPQSLPRFIYDEKTEGWIDPKTNEPAPDYVKDIGLIL